MKEGKARHIMMTELGCAKASGLKTLIEGKDFLIDVKFLMREYYMATFTEDGNGLKIAFSNGQSFRLSVEETYN